MATSDKHTHESMSRDEPHSLAHVLCAQIQHTLEVGFGLCPLEGMAVLTEATSILMHAICETSHINPAKPQKHDKGKKTKKSGKAKA